MKRTELGKVAIAASSALAVLAFAGLALADSMSDLVAAAKKEGQLTIIAVPHDWCDYGDIIDGFKAAYGLKMNEFNPDGGSGDEIEAIKANKGNIGPQAPDVIDVGLSFGPSAKAEGLLQPYKVSTWDTIPSDQKDAAGYWYGDYYGVLAFEVNADVVKNPADRLARSAEAGIQELHCNWRRPADRQRIDPDRLRGRTVGDGRRYRQAADAGLDYFAQLNKAGNFVPIDISAASLAQGTAPIGIRWDYLALGDRDTLKGNPPVTVVVPKTGIVGGVYVQAISAYAPHPNAAKLWMEWLYSDTPQLVWLKGYCHPIRFQDLVKNGKVPPGPSCQTAAGGSLRQGSVSDPRSARRVKGDNHQEVGCGRRRDRKVTLIGSAPAFRPHRFRTPAHLLVCSDDADDTGREGLN